MDYKDGKWAKKIIELQHKDGSWGYFHSLSKPTPKQPLTTEHALRRLEILGFNKEDKPIKKALKYLNNCLKDHKLIPDHYEKGSDWKTYLDLMLSTWIRKFDLDNKTANDITKKWTLMVNNSFAEGRFNQNVFNEIYYKIFKPEKGKRTWGFMGFYGISILTNTLSKNIEPDFFEYVINYPTGIYYFGYGKSIIILPETFQSKETSDYLRMIELLTAYNNIKCKEKILFVKKWLEENKLNEKEWDLGKKSKDNIVFPLSDSWRKDEDRIMDCTFVINKIIKRL